MERLRQIVRDAASFLRALVWPVAGSVRDNVGLASLSVVLGIALWVFVTDSENPTRSGVPPFDLPVEPVNVPGDLALAAPPVNVRVRVEVAEDVWNTLTRADFTARVDLDGFQAGTYDVPVRVEPQTGRGNLHVLAVIPESVEVELRPLFSKSVPVSVSLEGSPPPGYESGVPELDTETVLVTGTQDRVAPVSQAVAKLDLTGRTDDTTQAVRLEARDARGFLVEGVTLEPGLVNVTVSIDQTQFSRALVVAPEVSGAPAPGYELAGVSVTPPVVTAFGDQSFLAEAAVIRTQPVDISGATSDVVRTVSLDLPQDVTLSGSTSVTVTVLIAAAQGTRTIGVTATVTGLAPDLMVSGPLPFVQVALLGELPTLQALLPNDISASINLSGLEAGTHEVSLSVATPAGVSLASVSPEKVEITLEPR